MTLINSTKINTLNFIYIQQIQIRIVKINLLISRIKIIPPYKNNKIIKIIIIQKIYPFIKIRIIKIKNIKINLKNN
jgi:hypothetical protein